MAGLFEEEGQRGTPPRYSRRLLVDACCYVLRSGCSWLMLPRDFPPWQNVYRTFRRWSQQGKFEQMHDRLRAQWRAREGRDPMPSAAVLDAQSTRSSPQGGPSDYDAGKKVKGRKRHMLVDTLGLVLAVSVTAASVQDRDGAHPVMTNGMENMLDYQRFLLIPTMQDAVHKASANSTAFRSRSYAILAMPMRASGVYRTRETSSRGSLMRKVFWFSQSAGWSNALMRGSKRHAGW